VGWPFKKSGFFERKHCTPSRIQRYRCLHCRRNFSTQTFETSYWLHKPQLLERIFRRVQACSGLRQIAFDDGISHTTLLRHIARLGRHCLLFQHAHRPKIEEPLVLDGFESFEYSQYFPFHFNVLVGKGSHFFYQFTDSPLRRKGRMTARQRHRRGKLEERLGRPDPRAIEKAVAEVLRLALPVEQSLTLHSDDHPAYPRAFKALPQLRIDHRVTPSTDRRTPHNPLFAVNLLDLLIRHGGSNHKRETIAFSKRRQGAIERLAMLQVWRNFMRPYSVQEAGPTPAQRAGAMATRLSASALLLRRLFPAHVQLPESLMAYYRRQVRTVALGVNREHRLRYAF
jgi:transposase-like protein